jgi:hypothetical protein
VSDLDQLNILESKAAEVDQSIDSATTVEGAPVEVKAEAPLREELAGVLNLVAKGGTFVLPTFATHFNQDANLQIADSMIELSELYKWDLRALMLAKNSPVLVWLGFAYALGIPTMKVANDYKIMKAAQRAAKENETGEVTTVKTEAADDQTVNGVTTGAD